MLIYSLTHSLFLFLAIKKRKKENRARLKFSFKWMIAIREKFRKATAKETLIHLMNGFFCACARANFRVMCEKLSFFGAGQIEKEKKKKLNSV